MSISFNEIMKYNGMNETVYEEIKKNQAKVVPFVGAGLSAFVYPTWKPLLENLSKIIGKCEVRVQIETSITAGEYEKAANQIYDVLGDFNFFEQIRSMYDLAILEMDCNRYKFNREAVFILPRLFHDFIITSNYDMVIEKAFATNQIPLRVAVPCNNTLHHRVTQGQIGNYLLKMHGDIDSETSDIVFTKESYDRKYEKGTDLRNEFESTLRNKPILFLGSSLNADRFLPLLEDMNRECRGLKHYAIICDDGADKNDRVKQLGDRYHIRTIVYPPDHHEAVRVILEKLLDDTNHKAYMTLPLKLSAQPIGSKFDYMQENTKFVGRESEIDQLNAFLNEENGSFCWWAITGEGGSGKSRLAHEFNKRIVGWDVITIQKTGADIFSQRSAQLSRNTCYILDYVQENANHIGTWMQSLLRESHCNTIRVLLIDRGESEDDEPSWLTQIIDSGGHVIKDAAYCNAKPLYLPCLSDDNLKSIILTYAKSQNAFLDEETVFLLLQRLKGIDKNLNRPLFGMFLTDAQVNEKNPLYWSKTKVLEYITQREVERYDNGLKSVFGINVCKSKKNAIHNILSVANMLNGMKFPSEVKVLLSNDYTCICKSDMEEVNVIDDLYRAGVINNENEIVPMKPDLVSEYFVYKQLVSCEKKADYESKKEYMRDLLNSIYQKSAQVNFFILKLILDYPRFIRKSLLEDVLLHSEFSWGEENSEYAKLHIIMLILLLDFDNIDIIINQVIASNGIVNGDHPILDILIKSLIKLLKKDGFSEEKNLILLRNLDKLYTLSADHESLASNISRVIFEIANEDQLSKSFLDNDILPRLHLIYSKWPESEYIRNVYGNCIGMQAYNMYLDQNYLGAAEGFVKSILLGAKLAKTNLAYMLRRKEIKPELLPADLCSIPVLLEEGMNTNEGVTMINLALYKALVCSSPDDWIEADNIMSQIEGDLSIIIEWWTNLINDDDMEGYLVIKWLERHRKAPRTERNFYNPAKEYFSSLENAPNWLVSSATAQQ